MIKNIKSGSTEYKEILDLRNKVLRIPLGMDIKNDDLTGEDLCQHLGFYNEEEMIGCLQIKIIDADVFQIRQMAVLPDHQRRGVGSALLFEAERIIKEHGGNTVLIESRNYAIPFYEHNGYIAYGEYFNKINIPHKLMKKNI